MIIIEYRFFWLEIEAIIGGNLLMCVKVATFHQRQKDRLKLAFFRKC